MKYKILPILILIPLMFFACKDSTTPPPESIVRGPGNDIPRAMFIEQSIATMGPRIVSIFFNAVDPDNNSVIDNLIANNLDVFEIDQEQNRTKLNWIANAFHLRSKDNLNYESRLVLILDVSAETNLAKIKEAATAVINNLSAGQQLSIISFSTAVTVVHEFSSDKTSLQDAVDQLVSGGAGSVLYDAIMEGIESWDDMYTYDEIIQGNAIVVTDGQNAGGKTSLIDLQFAITASEPAKRIYVFGVGSGVDSDALEEIGTAGYYAVSSMDGLPGEITKAESNIAAYESGFYMFDFMSTRREGTFIINLELIDNQYTGEGSVLESEYTTVNFYPSGIDIKKGIMVNANKSMPDGVTELKLGKIAPRVLTAFNNYGAEPSTFVWSSNNPEMVTIEEDPTDNRKAVITAVGEVGDVATLVVKDSANGADEEKGFTVEIVETKTGSALFEYFENLPGRGLFLLTKSGKFPDNPDVRTTVNELNITAWDGNKSENDDFGCRFRAYLIPPETGLFSFSLSMNVDQGEEQGELYLSQTALPDDTMQRIAWNTEIDRDVTSDNIYLEEGKIYYLDFIYKEDRYDHACAVRWKRDTKDLGDGESVIGTRSVTVEGQYLAPFITDFEMTE